MVDISVVIPVYGCASCLVVLNRRLTHILKQLTTRYEIIYIDDHSQDEAWTVIKRLHRTENRVIGLRLSRNFGQHHAITAGIDRVKGQWTVVMDCDLQDSPEDIPLLFQQAQKGYDVVFARRTNRQDGYFKKIPARIFHTVFAVISGMSGDPTIGNFGIYSQQVIHQLKQNAEQNRSFLQAVKWLGFRQATIDSKHSHRFDGRTGYNLKKLMTYAIDCVTAYSDAPLWLPLVTGLILLLLSGISVILLMIDSQFSNLHPNGTQFILILLTFLGGLILTAIGIVSIYIAKIFAEIRHRPLYIVQDSVGI
jgi:glycosyltransferase involved in cell wall biosynthesis